ncbi:hypothetical protein RJT34_02994 [Clitoria ternatea]|uniref:Uncharacterized protein n=1 Tax=Clitoria ternatea TaxID=43366 RepID=A0AAN9KI36_CLITE
MSQKCKAVHEYDGVEIQGNWANFAGLSRFQAAVVQGPIDVSVSPREHEDIHADGQAQNDKLVGMDSGGTKLVGGAQHKDLEVDDKSRGTLKREMVKELVNREKVAFIGIQETKLQLVDNQLVSSLWNTSEFDWVALSALRAAGGCYV